MIKVSAVSYLNTFPFIYGLQTSELINNINLQLYYPSICGDKLIDSEVDLALVPIVVIKDLKQFHLISNYCIGSNGPVDTVCVYSDVPIYKVQNIMLDYQSRTSVELLKVLLRDYWALEPNLIKSEIGADPIVEGRNASLVIGDRAFKLNGMYNYTYDLSEIWNKMTGLPFVFAVWISNKELSKDFKKDFNNALEYGIQNIHKSLSLNADEYLCKDPYDYLTNKISYTLDSNKTKAMELFLSKI